MIAIVSLVGLLLFAWPFLGFPAPGYLPALTVAGGSIAALALVEAGTRRLDARRFAVLAVIAAIDSLLRAYVVTGIGGFSPIFLLVLCAGAAFGPSFGFLAGAAAILASAVATGGIGPWLPYQVFATGWVGAAAGLASPRLPPRLRLPVLALVGTLTGYAFGAVMDAWDWSYFRGDPGLGWSPGLAPAAALYRFTGFYLNTSAAYDTFRAAGNALAVLLLGAPILAALDRFRSRLRFVVVAPEEV